MQLPEMMHRAVATRGRNLGGNARGLVKYVWTIAALVVLEMDEELLRRAATSLRDICERHPDEVTRWLNENDPVSILDLTSYHPETVGAESVAKLRRKAEHILQKQATKRARAK